jgi:hypothetical protein
MKPDELAKAMEAAAAEYACVPKRAADGTPIPPTAEHDKCYANYILTSNPPQHPWICRRCRTRGVDVGTYTDGAASEYNRLCEPPG